MIKIMDDNKFNFNWSAFKLLIPLIRGYFSNWYMVETRDAPDIFENKDFFLSVSKKCASTRGVFRSRFHRPPSQLNGYDNLIPSKACAMHYVIWGLAHFTPPLFLVRNQKWYNITPKSSKSTAKCKFDSFICKEDEVELLFKVTFKYIEVVIQ